MQVVAAVVVAGVAATGFVHITHGAGIRLCAKQGWSLSDTIIDVGDYVDKPALLMVGKERVVADLARCGILRVPAIERQQLELFIGKQVARRKMRTELRNGGSTIAVIGDSTDCDNMKPSFAAYSDGVPDGTMVLCDTNMRIVWMLHEVNGHLE